jgi:hypothetical protein
MSFFDSVSGATSSLPSMPGGSSNPKPPPEEVKQPAEYKYIDYIRTPDDMGASSAGNLTALSNDVKALLGYVDVLVTGKGKAQKINSPLGNKFFMDANTECKANGENQPRFVFINNIPDGNIPLMPGTNKDFRGLVPGMLEGLGYMNPGKLFTAFSGDNTCQRVIMNVRDVKNISSTESRYVLNSDLKEYNPCWFTDRRNPVTNERGKKCEGFVSSHIPKDPIVNAYVVGIGLLLTYMVYRFVQKKN